MTPEEKKRAIERYADRLKEFGTGAKALGWRDAAQQELRFAILAGGGAIERGDSVLDIGCGFGDLYGYFEAIGIGTRYTGCDISPDVLAVARERHPDLTFEQRDILERPYPDRTFDHVFISGIFNHVISDNIGFMERTLAAAFGMCSKSLRANMTTDHVDYRDAHLHYFNPERVLAYCRGLSRHVAIRHDYPLYEFSVFVYRSANTI